MQEYIEDLRIASQHRLMQPNELIKNFSQLPAVTHAIQQARLTINNIIHGNDARLVVVVGPCSIHDEDAALEYAGRLKKAANFFADDIYILMRAYFEKPRTTIGWKGLISDPHLDGSFDIHYGLKLARKILLAIANLYLPTATEFLDTLIPQYLSDLIAWTAIGARTSASQTHRELASGLSMPVGFKNTPEGNVKTAIDAVDVARSPHHFLGISKEGFATIISTKGNENCHVILRGSDTAPNYTTEHVEEAIKCLKETNLTPRLMIDCSHGNSRKNYQLQQIVIQSICDQLENNSDHIFGIMLESNLVAGKQSFQTQQPLLYGQSITDGCISWEETLPLLEKLALASSARKRLSQKRVKSTLLSL
jgi:3-deoxy-7-phosphoheptulonate synthase